MTPPPSTGELEAVLGARDFLRRLARGLVVDEHRAEDLVQETCARALVRRPRQAGALRRWMAGVLRNLAVDEGLRERARPAVEARAARHEAVWAAEERDLELERDVLEAVRGLRQPYRTTIYLRYYRGLSPPDIARRLDEPVATVKTRLRRGLELLRVELDRRHDGDRRAWCAALVVLALPELVGTGAGTLSAGTALKGLALMNKPLTFALSAAVLAAVATVAWNSRDAGGPGSAEPERSAALAPGIGPAEAAAPEVSEDEAGAAARDEAARRALSIDEPAVASAAAAPGTGLVGRVVDEGGRPVAEARVEATRDGLMFFTADGDFGDGEAPDPYALTGPDGAFRLPVTQDGAYSLIVSAAGFAPFRKEVTGYYDLETDLGDLTLSTGVVLSGRVVDASGAPVAGAEISSSPEDQSGNVISFGGEEPVLATTDASGAFVVDRQAVGAWRLTVRSPDHPDETISGETQRAGERVSGLEVVVQPGATLAGRLIDAPPTRPGELWVRAARKDEGERSGPGFRVMGAGGGVYGERVAPVGPDGRFELRGLEAGARYRLRAYDREDAYGGRSYSQVVEADAGASEVALPWSTGAAITAQFVDARTGAPVERFELAVGLGWAAPFERDGQLVTHHPDGRVRADGLRVSEGSDSAKARLRVNAAGYAPWEREDLTVQRDRELDLGVVRLEPVPLARVTVLDDLGRPVEGARVRLREAAAPGQDVELSHDLRLGAGGGSSSTHTSLATREGRTGEDGVATFSGLPGMRAVLSVEAPRHAEWRGEALELPTLDDYTTTVRLERGAVAEVQVVDADGVPVPGARVQHRELGGDETDVQVIGVPQTARVTDSEGRVFFRNLRAGQHGFRLDDGGGGGFVMRRGGGRAMASISLGGAETPFSEYELAAGETRVITLAQGVASALTGIVTEAGLPLAGAEVRLVADGEGPMLGMGGGGPRAETDERGNYAFEGVEPGSYELVVSHEGRALPHREELELRAGAERFDVELDVTILEGTIEDEEGRPLANARVRAERVKSGPRRSMAFVMITSGDEGGTDVVVGGGDAVPPVETDEDGRYVLRGVPSGVSVRIVAEAAGHSEGKSEPFELAVNEKRAGLDLALRPAGSIAVEVLRADGAPAAQVLLRLERLDVEEEGGQPNILITNVDGRARFKDLAPGRYQVNANPVGSPGGEAEPAEVIVVAGEESPLRIDLP